MEKRRNEIKTDPVASRGYRMNYALCHGRSHTSRDREIEIEIESATVCARVCAYERGREREREREKSASASEKERREFEILSAMKGARSCPFLVPWSFAPFCALFV
jgi:hypothetical protein